MLQNSTKESVVEENFQMGKASESKKKERRVLKEGVVKQSY